MAIFYFLYISLIVYILILVQILYKAQTTNKEIDFIMTSSLKASVVIFKLLI